MCMAREDFELERQRQRCDQLVCLRQLNRESVLLQRLLEARDSERERERIQRVRKEQARRLRFLREALSRLRDERRDCESQ